MAEYLYHYTSAEGVQGIKESGYIRQSTNLTRDAVLGQGVYFTDLPPSTDKQTILDNNWGPGSGHKAANIQYYVKIRRSELTRVQRKRFGDRVIYCYANQVNLRDFTFEIGVTGTSEIIDTSGWSWVAKAALGVGLVALGAGLIGLLAGAFSSDDRKERKSHT